MSNLDSQLKTFLQVAQHGSFRRAAEELFVTQAAVTSRIKMLEQWLGFTVFVRHRRGADLTAQGERFIDYARNAIDIIEHGREDGRRTRGYRAHYRFMSQYMLLAGFALDWIDWMQQHAADVSISIDSNHSTEATREISSGLLDMAVGYQHRSRPGVVFEDLFYERLVLVTSWTDTENWRKNYIPIGWDGEFEAEQRRFVGELVDNSRVSAAFVDTARNLILRAPGSAYVVERVALPSIEGGQLHRVPQAPEFERPAQVLYPANPSNPEIHAIALQGLRELAQNLNG